VCACGGSACATPMSSRWWILSWDGCELVSDDCVRTVTLGGLYYDNAQCSFTARETLDLHFTYFDTESCCDRLRIDGRVGSYSGSGPEASSLPITIWEGETLNWESDFSVTRTGWEVCASELGSEPDSYGDAGILGLGVPDVVVFAPLTIVILAIVMVSRVMKKARTTGQRPATIVRQMTRFRRPQSHGSVQNAAGGSSVAAVAAIAPIASVSSVSSVSSVAPMAAGGTGSMTDQLTQLSHLRDQGILSEAQFEAGKARILGVQPNQAPIAMAVPSQYIVPMAQPVQAQATLVQATVVQGMPM
jgi:hypothetical protein